MKTARTWYLFAATAGIALLGACSSADTSEPTGSSSAAVTRMCGAPTNGAVQGYDVSYYQGNFDWQAAKNGGIAFGFARVSDGTGYIDPKFDQNWTAMKAAGVLRGAYQFFEPAGDEVAQANLVVSKIGMLGDGDLPAMIDVEATGGQSPATISAKIKTWLRIVEQGTGRKPFIYSGSYFWEGNVKDTTLGAYPFWIAAYGVTCPSMPDQGWAKWTFWQYSDGNGSLDHDVFNGTLAELQAMARAPDRAPRGSLDAADCSKIAGWSQDEDTPAQTIAVDLYFDGVPGSGAVAERVTASNNRMDLCSAIGSCDHGFSIPTPRALRDNKPHVVRAYGIDSAPAGMNDELGASAKSFTCAPEAIPPKMARRWVTSPAAFGAWKFSALDVGHYSDAELAKLPKIADQPVKPSLAQADDGSAAIWVIDGTTKRHVVDPASMAAWHFAFADAVKTPAAKLAAMTTGPDWLPAPLLVQGAGAEVDVLDVAPETAPGADGGSDGGGGPGTPPPSSGDTPGDAPVATDSGCNASGHGRADGSWMVLLLGLAFVRRRR